MEGKPCRAFDLRSDSPSQSRDGASEEIAQHGKDERRNPQRHNKSERGKTIQEAQRPGQPYRSTGHEADAGPHPHECECNPEHQHERVPAPGTSEVATQKSCAHS